MKTRAQLITFLSVIFLAGCSTMNVTSNQFIPRDSGNPARLKKLAPAYQIENIEFKHPSGAISRGIFVHKPDAQFTVLYFMGSGVRIDANGAMIAKPFIEMNANFISYDYHDFGRSEAPAAAFGLKELAAETLSLYDHIRATTKGMLVVQGHSYGSFVAAKLASQRNLDALVLEGTGTSAQAYVDDQIPWFAKPFVSAKLDQELLSINNGAALRTYQGPVLIISGTNDVQTPIGRSRQLFDSLTSQHKRFEAINEAGHMNAMTKPQTLVSYRAFIEEARH
ncbi:alpha/beta fold hydrolase [Pseudoduganella rhizocola]|uniref:alpha/beta fold hydrolase n=1 Tax=Pseudoduganella rhizocola TaxID=3382643 RepID=UPI0038B69EEB